MIVINENLTNDISLDTDAFLRAIREFQELGMKIRELRSDIEEMMNILESGFDTPAGREFLKSCKENIYEPLDQQKQVIDYISTTLTDTSVMYESVFSDFESLKNKIDQISTY